MLHNRFMTISTTSLNLAALNLAQALPQLANTLPCTVHTFDNAEYGGTYNAMLATTLGNITAKKQSDKLCSNAICTDELWLVEHQNVFTLGQAGKPHHLLRATTTPVVQTDRGGQITWHGQGQLVSYFLFDLARLGFGVRDLVSHTEQALEDVLAQFLPPLLTAKARRDAPGVYIYDGDQMIGKIASLGFKIKHSHSYHGLAVNLINDLSAFDFINPCGYAGMTMVRLADFGAFDGSQTGDFINALLDNITKRRAGLIALRSIGN